MKKSFLLIVITLLILLSTSIIVSQDLNQRITQHRFPKLFIQIQAYEPNPEILMESAKRDLLVLDAELVSNMPAYLGRIGHIRNANPSAVILLYFSAADYIPGNTATINKGFLDRLKNSHIMKDINGNDFLLFDLGGGNWTKMINLTTNINQIMPDYLNQNVIPFCDGIFYDWINESISWLNNRNPNPSNLLDINNDGIAEPGKVLDSLWVNGTKTLLTNTHTIFPENSLIVGNGGWRFDDTYSSVLHGRMQEEFMGGRDIGWGWHFCMHCQHLMMPVYMNPRLPIILTLGAKNDYAWMRFGLSSALLIGSYYGYTNKNTTEYPVGYTSAWWYDEYAVDMTTGKAVSSIDKKGYLGDPINEAHDAKNENILLSKMLTDDDVSSEQKVWRRDFENGIVFCNPTAHEIFLTQADVIGTRNTENIYRISGIQDFTVNNGQKVSNGITIPSEDGIILLVGLNMSNIYELSKNLPEDFILYQNYPNPFNPSTTIKYQLPKSCHVKLKVYDFLGRRITTLVNEEKLPGQYDVKFNGTDLSSGMYLCQIQIGQFTQTRKMILIR